MRGRKRPKDEAAGAVGLASVVGISEASRRTGIPRQTIQSWWDSPEFGELRQRSKEVVADEWWAGIQRGAKIIMDEMTGSAPLRDKVIAFGVLTEKMLLIRGEATARSESKDITSDLPDSVKRDLRSRYADLIRSGSAAVDGEGVAGTTTSGG